MKRLLRASLALLALAGVFSGPSRAVAADQPAQLIVKDDGGFFTPGAVSKAKEIVAQSKGAANRQVHVYTIGVMSQEDRAEFDKTAGDARNKFRLDWAKKKIGFGDRGVEVILVKDPRMFEIFADRQMRDHGFGQGKWDGLKGAMLPDLKKVGDGPAADSRSAYDAALIAGAEYLRDNLPSDIGGREGVAGGEKHKAERGNAGGSSGIMGYVCIGLAVLAGIWLVMGLFRAFSGGGGGGPGGMGGGGGGFGSSLLGGLFGAVAGMWLYNNLFGGSSTAWGGDSGSIGGGDIGGGSGDTGAGDFSGDQGVGGDYGSGSDSGGGGDWGGGDSGGGGGDWGGGGGDY